MNKVFIEQFQQEGYVNVPGLFSKEEVSGFLEHYMALRASSEKPGDFSGVDLRSNDPLKKYPRMIHIHRWDERSLEWMIDPD